MALFFAFCFLACSVLTQPCDPESGTCENSLRVFTPEELQRHDGSDPSAPLYLAIMGEVYDVSAGAKFYGKAGGYHFFAGKDCSSAYATGKFDEEGLTSDLSGITVDTILSIFDWKSFYDTHKAYKRVGVLSERFYTAEGAPTTALREAWLLKSKAEELKATDEALKQEFPACHSRATAKDPFVELWCPEGKEGPGYVRLLVAKQRCVCATTAQLADTRLGVYEGCPPDAHYFKRPI
eukprot:NODE_4304_length_809_cov_47.089443_g4146_i0.p1 GENE.NODE_4304_length_809_cov_47.089443_g4146_i0~~NODE_4304_length_809_cov_47.089443_g4146_i0.p1  ORF type:complete len:255 (+),score=74.64 NODE_4304_length_809_cov_47.089443_g4146_i0:56-766(+)